MNATSVSGPRRALNTNTNLLVAENEFAVDLADGGIVETDMAVRVSSKDELVVVDRETRDEACLCLALE